MTGTRTATKAFAMALATVLALATTPVAAQAAFSNQTATAGVTNTPFVWVDMAGRSHYPGGAVGDFNRDGWPDIFFLGGGGTEDKLFINDGDGTFTDEAVAWGVFLEHRGRAITVGDFNNDGWHDVYITSGGDMSAGDRPGQHILYRNNGNGTFTNVATVAGVNHTSATFMVTTTPAFGDYDLDGDLDLFVATWGVGSDGNRLFRNNGDETFTDVTIAAGLNPTGTQGFAPRFADMNGDRYPELLIAADFETSRYYINDGDGTFTDGSAASGTGLDSNGMGTTVADVNHDGFLDWYVTSIYRDNPFTNNGNFMYINQGNDTFVPLLEAAGAKDGGWGWGTEALDFDHDGWIDLAATNAGGDDSAPEWQFENSYLFRNNGDTTFSDVTTGSGFDHTDNGRGLFILDYDRDGAMDIVITSYNDTVALFRNDISGPNTNWIELSFDTSANPGLAPDGFGTRVVVTTGSFTQHHYLSGGATYVSQSQLAMHFGLGSATTIDTMTVEWADGTTTVLNGVPANQIMTIAAPAPVPGAPGEASKGGDQVDQMLASYDSVSGTIDVTFTAACDATNHTVYYGDLADISAYDYSGAACFVGSTGDASFDPGLDSAFFVVVGNDGAVEGPYGVDHAGFDRPEDTGTVGCDLPQDLSGTCDLP
jgi:hypothetical protein